MEAAFDAASLERRYAFLDDCPESLFAQLVTLPIGTLPERVEGVRRWRDALLDGTMPAPDGWPPETIAGPMRHALEALGIARFCRGQPELVDLLLKDVLSGFAHREATLRSEVSRRLEELEELERDRLSAARDLEKRLQEIPYPRPPELDEETLRRLLEQAESEAAQRATEPDAGLVSAWSERVRVWAEVADVFGDLGTIMGRGWDMSLGVLRHSGWHDLARLRQLVEQLPQLRAIVQALGRLHESDQEPSIAERILEPVRRLEEERREIRTPLVPSETRGIERSGEIARMLPVEALMLGHPKLRLLWHARRAERALLTYRVEGIEYERVEIERESQQEVEGRRPRPERGPILAIVDTSGSMHGLPEQVAKALVLEAMRTAHAEKRRCFVYAYSGPGQVLEEELDLTPEGVGRLLQFLGFTFGGGNDETGVMSRVVARLREKDWKKADVVFVSDGEWPAPTALVAAVDRERMNGTRFHGVQVGNRGRTGLHAVCEPVHEFRDWAAAGGWE